MDFLMLIEPLFKVSILISFPIFAYVAIKWNYERLFETEFNIKYSTLYTDMKHKPTAVDTIILLCGRRLLIVMTTVFLNRFHLPMVFFYIYPSLWLLQYYISK